MEDGAAVPAPSLWARLSSRSRPWALGLLAVIAYGLWVHLHVFVEFAVVPRFVPEFAYDGRYDHGAVDMVPINLATPFALVYAILVVRTARRWFDGAGIPPPALVAAARYVSALAAVFVAAFLVCVNANIVTALLLLVKVAACSVADIPLAPLLAVGMFRMVPHIIPLSLAAEGVLAIGPMLWLIWRTRPRAMPMSPAA